MTWACSRNNTLTSGTAEFRGVQFLILIKEVLVAAGWSLIGTADGVDDVDLDLSGGATDYFPVFPAVTDMDDGAWFAVESASGAQLVFQADAAGTVDVYASPLGAYTDDTPTHSTRLGGTTPPADEFQVSDATYAGVGVAANQKVSISYSDDAKSWIAFGINAGNDNVSGFWIETEYHKAGDPAAYIGRFYCRASYDCWDNLNTPEANSIQGWHPSSAVKEYCLGLPMFDSVDIIATLPVDPVSSDEQLIEAFVGCQTASFYHFRGKASGIVWMSGNRSTGDTFEGDRYMGIGKVAIDGWNSGDALGT
jgi:hypothetical protein